MNSATIHHYHQHAARYQQQYDALPAGDVHAEWAGLLRQRAPGLALDIGAGSGRDARWLAAQGWQVTAVEPAEALRKLGEKLSSPAVTWHNAQLPELESLHIPDQGFDLILLSAVWMHLLPAQRPRAFQRLQSSLSENGMMIITLRFGPSDPDRPMYEVSVAELAELAKLHGLILEDLSKGWSSDKLQRTEVCWKTVCIRFATEQGG
jgi:SAM-dependent methyltransferase